MQHVITQMAKTLKQQVNNYYHQSKTKEKSYFQLCLLLAIANMISITAGSDFDNNLLGNNIVRSLDATTGPCLQYYPNNQSTAHCQYCQVGYSLLLLNPNSTICGTLNITNNTCAIDIALYPQYANHNSTYFQYKPGRAPLGSLPYCFDCATYFNNLNSVVQRPCISCQPQLTDTNTSTQALASSQLYFKQSIISQSEGCSLCNTSTSTDHSNSPTLVYQPQAQLYMRQCPVYDKPIKSCNVTSYYNSTLQLCQSCAIRFPNCAACNSTKCLLCPDGFFWNPSVFSQINRQLQGICVFNACPKGTCRNMTQGHTQCTTPPTDNITNCMICTELQKSYSCELCNNGYFLKSNTSCIQLSSQVSVNLYVRSGAPYSSFNSTDAAQYLVNDGSSASKAVYFIPHAIYKAQQLLKSNKKVTANIYIGKGSHFLFYCDGTESYDIKNSGKGTTQMLQYCKYDIDSTTGLGVLHRQYQAHDNLILKFQALDCLLMYKLDGMTEDLEFEQLCLDQHYDLRPVIYVNKNNYYFNITGYASFTKLQFTGVNAFSVPNNFSLTLSTYPVQLCNVPTSPTGSDGILKVTSLDIGVPILEFSCIDSFYRGSKVPSDTTTNRRCADAINSDSPFSIIQQSTLKCASDPRDPEYFSLSADGYNFYSQRRKSLFVLYGFADYQSQYLAPPQIYLSDCDFLYFYGNYDSLITVENNNFQQISYNHTYMNITQGISYQQTTFYSMTGQDRGAKITIANSVFKYARFCRGLIFYRKQPYIPNTLSFTNYTNLYNQYVNSDQAGSQILIYGSQFQMLNTYSNTTALAIIGAQQQKIKLQATIEDLYYEAATHKGIVLNIEDFYGAIEILNCDFRQNWHFVPEILITNYTYGDMQSLAQFEDKFGTKEYQMAICDQNSKIDRYLFKDGLNKDTNIDELYDKFERLSMIYISRHRNLLIIRDTKFLQNIGTFGGSISINSPNWDRGSSPYVIVSNCFFSKNIAYFSGNAIYMRFTKRKGDITKVCGSGMITNNQFTENIGMKIHNGGAISSVCKLVDIGHQDYFSSSGYLLSKYSYATYRQGAIKFSDIFDSSYAIQVFLYKLNIQDNIFVNNYSGNKGSAVYIKYISDVRVSNCTFSQNGPVYAYTELLSSPIVTYLNRRALTYFEESERCFDEFDHLQKCSTPDTYIQWAQIQGALYIEHCQERACLASNYPQYTNITSCEFNNNQVGPVVDYTFSNELSTSVQIRGGYYNTIQKSIFYNHYNLYEDYIETKCTTMKKYFPETYFDHSMASLIRLSVNVTNYTGDLLLFNTTLFQNKIYNNQNVQVLGMTSNQQYKGSLIYFATSYSQKSNHFNALLLLNDNEISANKFIGSDSSLIYVNNGQLHVQNTQFQNNGFLSSNSFSNVPSNNKTMIGQFIHNSYSLQWQQTYGCIFIENNLALPSGISHEIYMSTFSYNFANKGAAIAAVIDGQYLSMHHNTYIWNFASTEGSVLYARTSSELENQQRGTIMLTTENIQNQFSTSYGGAISIKAAVPNYLSILISNTVFTDCVANEGTSLYFNQLAKILLDKTTFTVKKSQLDLFSLAQQQFQVLYLKQLSYYIDMDLLQTLIVQKSVPLNGYIVINSALNNQNVMFMSIVQQASTNSLSKYAQIMNSQFYNQTSKTASAVQVQATQVYIQNSKFINNSQTVDGGNIALSENSLLLAQVVTFQNCNTAGSGSAISMDSSQSVIFSSNFLSNTALEQGTLYLSNYAQLNCNKCIFRSNKAFTGSAISSINKKILPSCVIYLSNSTFSNNIAQSSDLISLVYSIINILNTQLIDNKGMVANNGITMIGSNAILNSVTINNKNIFQGSLEAGQLSDVGFFSLSQNSHLNITNNSLISDCKGSLAGVLYATGHSSIFIDKNTTFINNFSPSGSMMSLVKTKYIQIYDSIFINNSLTTLKLESADALIQNCQFQYGDDSFIYARKSQLLLISNNFKDAANYGSKGGMGLFCQNCYNLTISNCTFSNLSAKEGGAVLLQQSHYNNLPLGQALIQNSYFTNNSAVQGGAIKLQDPGTVKFISNTFENNKAIINTQSDALGMLKQQYSKSQGGAIYYACIQYAACNVSMSNKNQFMGNTADDEGGALSRMQANFTDDGTSIFSNNKAPYGKNLASYPKYIQMSTITSNTIQDDNRRMLQSVQNNTYITSGQPFKFTISMYDQDNNLYTADSQSAAKIYANQKVASLINNVVVAQSGVFNFSNVQVTTYPGTSITFSISITGLQTFGNQLELPNNQALFTVTSKACVSGQYQTESGSCFTCPDNYYSLVAPNKQLQCVQCPLHAICSQGALIGPQQGYWRSSSTSQTFIACYNSESCLAADASHPTGICAEGYQGYLCEQCGQSYIQKSIYQCNKCPTLGAAGAKIAIVLIIMISIVYLLVRTTLTSAGSSKPIFIAYLKIIINHFQLIGPITLINYGWPHPFHKIQLAQEVVSYLPDHIFEFDCLLKSYFQNVNVFYQKLLIYAFLPLILCVSALIFWVIYCAIIRSFYKIMDYLASTIIVLLYLVIPSIAQYLVSSLACTKIDGTSRLIREIEIVCYQKQHLRYMLGIALPGYLIWCIGFPLIALFLLIKNRKHILQIENSLVQSRSDRIVIYQIKSKYGFVFNGYKLQPFYWEIVVFYRKIFMITVLTLLVMVSPEVQILSGLLIIVISMLVHQKFQPFYTTILNRMEAFSLLVVAFTLYIGMFYTTDSEFNQMDAKGPKRFFFIIILIPNMIFYCYWLFWTYIEILKMLLDYNHTIFRFITCGFSDIQKFKNKYCRDITVYETPDKSIASETPKKISKPPKQAVGAPVSDFDDINQKTIKQVGTERQLMSSSSFEEMYSLDKKYEKDDILRNGAGDKEEDDDYRVSQQTGRIMVDPKHISLNFAPYIQKPTIDNHNSSDNNDKEDSRMNSKESNYKLAQSNKLQQFGNNSDLPIKQQAKVYPEQIRNKNRKNKGRYQGNSQEISTPSVKGNKSDTDSQYYQDNSPRLRRIETKTMPKSDKKAKNKNTDLNNNWPKNNSPHKAQINSPSSRLRTPKKFNRYDDDEDASADKFMVFSNNSKYQDNANNGEDPRMLMTQANNFTSNNEYIKADGHIVKDYLIEKNEQSKQDKEEIDERSPLKSARRNKKKDRYLD